MALIDCVECGKQISDQAASCPGCGSPLKVTSSIKSEQVEDLKKEVKSLGRRAEYRAGEELGEFIGNYLPIFVFMFFSANYVPRLIQSYFGLSADVYQNITVVGVLLIIPMIIFRKRLTGRAGWIAAVVLIAAAIFSPDIVTPEEKAQKAAFEEYRPLISAANGLGSCTQSIINMKRSGNSTQLEEAVTHCDAMKANFTELAESSSDEFVARLCAGVPTYNGGVTKSLHREQSPDVDDFCESRNL